jgi:hypothetical protein
VTSLVDLSSIGRLFTVDSFFENYSAVAQNVAQSSVLILTKMNLATFCAIFS